MKKIMMGVFLLAAGFLATTSRAATTATLLVRVTPTGTKSVALSTGTLDLGNVALTTTATSSLTVTNDGTIAEQLGLRITDEDSLNVWTATTTGNAGMDTYNLRGVFQNAAPAFAANDDILLAGATTLATAAVYGDGGAGDGSNVPPVASNTRSLWLELNMPTGSSSTGQRDITVEVSAN